MVETRVSVLTKGCVFAGQFVTSGPQLVIVTTLVNVTTSSSDVVVGEEYPPVKIGTELLPVGYGALEDPDLLGRKPLEAPEDPPDADADADADAEDAALVLIE